MTLYVDSSALVKTLTYESESADVIAVLDDCRAADVGIVSSAILITEVHSARIRLDLDRKSVEAALDSVELVACTYDVLHRAGLLAGRSLRSLDAIHVASALEVGADVFYSFDVRQNAAAVEAGLALVSRSGG